MARKRSTGRASHGHAIGARDYQTRLRQPVTPEDMRRALAAINAMTAPPNFEEVSITLTHAFREDGVRFSIAELR